MKYFIIFVALFSFITQAETNFATINSVKNGFATVKECGTETSNCNQATLSGFEDILNLTTTNQCIASKVEYEENGLSIPDCPKGDDKIKGLDNTHPNGGLFTLYTGNNSSFLFDLASNYLKNNEVGKFNLVIPKTRAEYLREDKRLLKLLNNKRVNIISVDTMPSVGMWMQDSFQFTSINSKPAIYQLEHHSENDELKDRLACELSKKCNIPYYIPPNMVDPNNKEQNSLNSGGNLEVLPGGTFINGVLKKPSISVNFPDDGDSNETYRTKSQISMKKSLKKSGNKVLELDVSFLAVGHVDEIVNIVKTDAPAPCNFAVMIASPKKAFELLEKNSNERDIVSYFYDFFMPNAHAAFKAKRKYEESVCLDVSYRDLQNQGYEADNLEESRKIIEKYNCIGDKTPSEFVGTDEYKILKRTNLEADDSIVKTMDQNKELIKEELIKTSGCNNPKFIDIPVFFRAGSSYTPDLVNGVVQTPNNSASKVILPKSYFPPFDSYVEKELSKVGVKATFAHDMGYHLNGGEVHCGTNSARICK